VSVRAGSRGVLGGALALVPLACLLGVACVEGVTPSCSDPAASCSPSIDGSAEGASLDATATIDARDASAPDAPDGDADADAPVDAPDGG
jgi:hypothetical protein